MAKLLVVAAGALIDADGRVLIAQRPEGKSLAGKWEFPGGKLGEGESPEAALVRELREELDVDTQEACLAPIAVASEPLGDLHLLMPLFVCRKWSGRPKPMEGQGLAWVYPRDLLKRDLVGPDRPLAAQLSDLL